MGKFVKFLTPLSAYGCVKHYVDPNIVVCGVESGVLREILEEQ
uniref:SAM-dependent methyltransferase n=1 Tax=Echinococcus granulosus TaxID=6210 RepID=A0A068X4V4_ECHGR|nr:hypothetical protein EgrG_000398800 [Echinococcus granulosus]